MKALQFSAAYFLVGITTGSVLGFFRTILLEPAFGRTIAVLVEIPLILWLCWIACGLLIGVFFDRRFSAVTGLGIGLTAFVLLICTEFVLGFFVFNRSVDQQLTKFLSPEGLLGLSAQIAYAVIPLVQRRLL